MRRRNEGTGKEREDEWANGRQGQRECLQWNTDRRPERGTPLGARHAVVPVLQCSSSPSLPLALSSFLILALLLFAGCTAPESGSADSASTAQAAADTVKTGAQVLAERGPATMLPGERIGLIVNHTALLDTTHLIDVVDAAPDVRVTALFGPEHGIRGEADAGEKVEDGHDVETGAPIHSLYGRTRKPTPDMLENVDVLVFDIQDIGARFYTYISTMGLAMQAAAEVGLPFVVLDRPNPLGGEHVAGWTLDLEYESFVGQYPIPVQHGLTVGELARMIQGEDWMDGLDDLDLRVVEMEGWQRDELWPQTGLPWTAPSPNIPDFETAVVYPGAGFFEAAAASEGRGTRHPFLLLGAPWVAADALADTLNARGLPGVRFEPAHFTPESIEGMASNPRFQDQPVHGIRHVVTDADAFRPVATGVHTMHAFHQQAPDTVDFVARPEWLAKLSGTERFRMLLEDGAAPDRIVQDWQDDVDAFRRLRQPYLLY